MEKLSLPKGDIYTKNSDVFGNYIADYIEELRKLSSLEDDSLQLCVTAMMIAIGVAVGRTAPPDKLIKISKDLVEGFVENVKLGAEGNVH